MAHDTYNSIMNMHLCIARPTSVLLVSTFLKVIHLPARSSRTVDSISYVELQGKIYTTDYELLGVFLHMHCVI